MEKKKKTRIEAKKRKAVAFLALVKTENDNSEQTIPPKIQRIKNEDNKLPVKEEISDTVMGGTSDPDVPQQTVLEPSGQPGISDEVLEEMRRLKRERQKASMQRPKLFTTLDELTRDFPHNEGTENVKRLPPLYMMDLQHLLLTGVLGNLASEKPRWCRLLRPTKITKVAVVVLDSVSQQEFLEDGAFPTLKACPDVSVAMVPPSEYGSSVREDLMTVPISVTQMKAMEVNVKQLTAVKEHLPIPRSEDSGSPAGMSTYVQDKFDRTKLLLSPAQMVMEGYPMPVDNDMYKTYVFTQDRYQKVTEKSPMFAVDCEMCLTVRGLNELTRVSLIDENLECLYDTFVKPYSKIINYLTRYSGITKAILDPVTTRLEDVQKRIRSILPPNAILCGQSLGGDLRALELFHPYNIDTSVIYNLSGNPSRKTGLKRLTSEFLGRSIQDSDSGHNSIEDARATMELVLLKARNGLQFGDYVIDHVLDSEEQEDVEGTTETCPDTELVPSHPDCDSKEAGDQTQTITSDTKEVQCDKQLSSEMKRRLQRRKLFFQGTGAYASQDFFTVLQKHKKSALAIDDVGSASVYQVDGGVQESSTDKESKTMAKASIKNNDFTLVHFYGYREFLQNPPQNDSHSEIKKKCLRQLDRLVWKVLKKMPSMSLFVVVLPGRYSEQQLGQDTRQAMPAMTFAKIT